MSLVDASASLAREGVHVEPGRRPIGDYGRYVTAHGDWLEARPRDAEQVRVAFDVARHHHVPVRVRGAGHSVNGIAVPRSGELLIFTERLDRYRFEGDRLRVGAGAIVWDVRDLVESRGLRLPVFNDGLAGPSVGGFVAAGGFGSASEEFGGFWANVSELRVVRGSGALARVTRDDPEFGWHFGSLGLLGAVVEATLDLVPGARERVESEQGVVPTVTRPESEDEEASLWFTVFVRRAEEDAARSALSSIMEEVPDAFRFFIPIYRYVIRHRGYVAPLVWPYEEDCVALGVWGRMNLESAIDRARVLPLSEAFTRLTVERGYRRYFQTEIGSRAFTLEGTYPPATLARLRELAARYGSPLEINRGILPWELPDGWFDPE